jgi:replication factor C subunit 3/5
MNLTLTEKYRPKNLDEIASQHNVTNMLRSYLKVDSIPHLLLYGPPGSGKTSTILALAREMFGETNMKLMMLELNGSDDRGISVIRSQIKNFSRLKNITCPGKPKLILLDEADSLTYDAQSALRRVMEKHTKEVRFCLVCNYINKLIPALQSRCTVFRYAAVHYDGVKHLLTTIIKKEKLNVDCLESIVEMSRGDMRKCLNFIDAHRSSRKVGKEDIITYYFGVDGKGLETIRTLITSRDVKANDKYKELCKFKDKYKLTMDNIFDVISHVGTSVQAYPLLAKLADLEYNYYKSRHTFESVFLRGTAVALAST